ncbi:MAG: peptide chain release factor N(5)-glutamine methyltransferase [Gammaproteobacteria bacterium]|nr:peptide chain release factor N(5)-glutamine methyltransferase [Gammaproteobacteria bacterium]
MPVKEVPLIKEALKFGYETLQSRPSYRLESEILLSHVLNVGRPYLYSHDQQPLSNKEWQTFQDFCLRCKKGEPIAYLTGYKEFWSLEFEVNKHTLIPRWETELLVQATLEKFARESQLAVLDLGVGCGALAVALAVERPAWDIYAVDISGDAIEVAKRNAGKYHAKNITFVESDWFLQMPQQKFDAIVSNPPYIAESDPHLAALNSEPPAALVSGKDGLDALGKIIEGAPDFLNQDGWLLLEHGYDQAERVRTLLHTRGFTAVKSHPDLGNIERITIAKWVR